MEYSSAADVSPAGAQVSTARAASAAKTGTQYHFPNLISENGIVSPNCLNSEHYGLAFTLENLIMLPHEYRPMF
jgi:hypothetical protein